MTIHFLNDDKRLNDAKGILEDFACLLRAAKAARSFLGPDHAPIDAREAFDLLDRAINKVEPQNSLIP